MCRLCKGGFTPPSGLVRTAALTPARACVCGSSTLSLNLSSRPERAGFSSTPFFGVVGLAVEGSWHDLIHFQLRLRLHFNLGLNLSA
jgi:hypothetical protein